MRSPVACNDAGLLEDEPFRTSFFVCGAANSSRTAGEQSRQRLQTIATQELIREPGGVRILFAHCSVLDSRCPDGGSLYVDQNGFR